MSATVNNRPPGHQVRARGQEYIPSTSDGLLNTPTDDRVVKHCGSVNEMMSRLHSAAIVPLEAEEENHYCCLLSFMSFRGRSHPKPTGDFLVAALKGAGRV